MDLGIVGLPASGKTSLFNALSGVEAVVGAYNARDEPNIGVVHVPDERLDRLAELIRSKRVTYAEIQWIDFPVAAFEPVGPGAKLLQQLPQMDALVLVTRAFADPTVPHHEGSVDAHRDIEAVNLELTYADLTLIERRLDRIEPELRSLPSAERGSLELERALLRRLHETLELGSAIRALDFSQAERRLLASYQFVTSRPLLIVVNVAEDDLARSEQIEAQYAARHGGPGIAVVALSAKVEAELALLDPVEAAEFRLDLSLPAVSPLDRVVHEAYALLGMHSFLTVGDQEARAWTLRRGSTALEAAGRIHTDMVRGFIRAEVSRWDELLEAGSEAELRRQGRLRTEGRDYVVQDGDVLHILFNV